VVSTQDDGYLLSDGKEPVDGLLVAYLVFVHIVL